MKDEINKIIQSISDFYKLDNALKYYLDRHKAQTLLDYITNLQEENEELNKDKNYFIDRSDELEEENEYNNFCNEKLREKITNLEYKITTYENHKSRNEKAIEYIKEHIRIDDEYPAYMEMLVEEKNELLNILQGGDK